MMKAGRAAPNATLLMRKEAIDSLELKAFEETIEKSRIPILLIFTSPGCKPCQLMESDLQDLETDLAGQISFYRICADTEFEIAAKFSVVSTPTIIMFIDGKPVMRLLGYVTKTDIAVALKEQIKMS